MKKEKLLEFNDTTKRTKFIEFLEEYTCTDLIDAFNSTKNPQVNLVPFKSSILKEQTTMSQEVYDLFKKEIDSCWLLTINGESMLISSAGASKLKTYGF